MPASRLNSSLNQPSLARAKVIRHARHNPKIVLRIVLRIRNPRIDVVNLDNRQPELPLQPGRHPTATQQPERLAIDGELKINIFLRAAEQDLPIRNIAAPHPSRIARPKQVVDDRDVLGRAIHVVRMRVSNIGDRAPLWRDVHQERTAAAIHPKTPTLPRRCVRMEVVVVRSNLQPGNIFCPAPTAPT